MTFNLNNNELHLTELNNSVKITNVTKSLTMTVPDAKMPENYFDLETLLILMGNYLRVY